MPKAWPLPTATACERAACKDDALVCTCVQCEMQQSAHVEGPPLLAVVLGVIDNSSLVVAAQVLQVGTTI